MESDFVELARTKVKLEMRTFKEEKRIGKNERYAQLTVEYGELLKSIVSGSPPYEKDIN